MAVLGLVVAVLAVEQLVVAALGDSLLLLSLFIGKQSQSLEDLGRYALVLKQGLVNDVLGRLVVLLVLPVQDALLDRPALVILLWMYFVLNVGALSWGNT